MLIDGGAFVVGKAGATPTVFVNFKVEGLLIAPISHWLLDLIKIGVEALEHWSATDGFGLALFTMILGIIGVQVLFFSVLLFVSINVLLHGS